MFEVNTLTSYAPAMHYVDGELVEQADLISQNELLVTLVNSISQMVIILNKNRQIIYSNNSFNKFCKVANTQSLIGKRFGETLGCTNAFNVPTGCGTSDFCKSCGAVNAIFDSQKGLASTNECKILTTNNQAFEFRVTATPFELENQNFTIFSILDISAEKRKESLERVFLHDILNSAGGISGLSSILKEIKDPKEMEDIADTIVGASNNLIEEIKAQRELNAAERGDLHPEFYLLNTFSVLQELTNIYSKHELNPGKEIRIKSEAEDIILKTDVVLLKRILGNMIKNAIEAYLPDDKITLNCTSFDNSVRFSVHNNSVIAHDVQRQLFKRTYSTKGLGRGMGSYSMKLLGETYLKGNVWFESNEEDGTTFFIELQK